MVVSWWYKAVVITFGKGVQEHKYYNDVQRIQRQASRCWAEMILSTRTGQEDVLHLWPLIFNIFATLFVQEGKKTTLINWKPNNFENSTMWLFTKFNTASIHFCTRNAAATVCIPTTITAAAPPAAISANTLLHLPEYTTQLSSQLN